MPTTVQAADGRTLELHEAGDPSGLPVIVHHGTPGSGVLYDRWATPGIRLIAYDRAGYGGSTRNRGRTISAVVAGRRGDRRRARPRPLRDVGHLGRRAARARLRRALRRPADRGSLARRRRTVGSRGLDWHAGMGEDNVKEFDLVLAGEEALRPAGRARPRPDAHAERGADWTRCSGTLLGARRPRGAHRPARRVAARGHAPRPRRPAPTAGSTTTSRSPRPWGFDVGDIARPTLIVHGSDDRFVPVSHGEWLAAHIPGAEAWIDDVNGHLTLLQNRVGEVHEWLLSHS